MKSFQDLEARSQKRPPQTWIDPKEKMVTIVMIQAQVVQVQRDFENAVMQAILE